MHPPQSTYPTRSTYFPLMRQVVSPARLEKYRQHPTDPDFDLHERYLWNIALCESFYCALQYLEVGLRNNVHNSAANHFGNPLWFDIYPSILQPEAHRQIAKVRGRLRRDQRSDAGRIVAGLDFGFWTSLFNDHYEQLLWRQGNLLTQVFPAIPNSSTHPRTRTYVSSRLNNIRKFRNRVFHHEPICNWRMAGTVRAVPQRHEDILEVLNWISPSLYATAQAAVRFPAVYAMGSSPYRNQLNAIINSLPPP